MAEPSSLPTREPKEEDPEMPSPVDESEEDEKEIPLTMAASVVLGSLPKDAREALRDAGSVREGDKEKVTIHFRPIGSAPSLPQNFIKSKVTATQPFSTVVRFLRRRLRLKESESVFCYLHSCFAPGLDESVGVLFKCFKTGEELVVSYAINPAFG